jgi:hypothetical protein
MTNDFNRPNWLQRKLMRLNLHVYQLMVRQYVRTHRDFRVRALEKYGIDGLWCYGDMENYAKEMLLYDNALSSMQREFKFVHRLLGGQELGDIV